MHPVRKGLVSIITYGFIVCNLLSAKAVLTKSSVDSCRDSETNMNTNSTASARRSYQMSHAIHQVKHHT